MRNARGYAPESRRARRTPGRRRIRKKESSETSTIPRVRGPVGGDHGFITFADPEQLILAHDVLAAILHVIFMQSRFHDGIDRTRLLAESAVNALEQIDVVARRAARAVAAHVGFDGDGERRADRFT